jgi:hypothetical protein
MGSALCIFSFGGFLAVSQHTDLGLQKNVGGCLDLIFGFSDFNDTAETDFGDFRRIIL